MAKKKTSSQAEKIVTDTKRKAPATKSVSKKTPPKKAANSKKTPKVGTEYENPISSSAVTALISFCLFLLLVLICVKPEGALLMVVRSVVLGLVGRAGFYFLIPALLYVAVVNLFGRKIAVRMRSVCAVLFALLCGVIYHLVVASQVESEPMQLLVSLYTGGTSGTSGGVVCGLFGYLLRWACGTALSYIITMLCAVLTLLGAMQITVPSLIRAIANRPRDDYEEDEEDDYIEPAAIVVNKIATRQIEQKRQRREQAKAQPVLPPEPEEPAQERMPEPKPRKEKRQEAPKQAAAVEPADTVKHVPGKGAAFMSRIDTEISAPLAGTRAYVHEDIPSVFDESAPEPETDPVEPEIPEKMPELVIDHQRKPVQVKPAPKKKAEPVPEPEPEPEKVTAKDTAAATKQVTAEIAQNQAKAAPEYCFPPIDLLKRPARGVADGTEEMRENSRRLNETLASFNIDAHIINVTRGPSVTRYEVELDRGVRLNKLTGCADDIALSLGASGVRIAAVPGKISVVGIEVPNRTVTTVSLREVIDSNEFASAKSKSSVALGKSIDGNCVVGNIAKMPHLLIAGTTGSGKSVCMNSIIISLLYKAGPEDIKLIMVDPKMVELGIYNGIPQLLIPVVTDPKKAAGSLQWAVTEMLRRYKAMSDLGVRDLESYNSIVAGEEDGQKLPSIVVIIDELADLMMVAAKEVEDSICRIAQMGRAAGMHLIIATQRPSANVITGLMKANIPSRIAFSVASAMESRIILDTMGAEKLVGKGDMLYAPIGSGKPLRVQGCFVTDSEVEAVAEYVKEHYVADYNQDVLEEIEKKAQQTGKKPASVSDPEPTDEELEGDEMLPAAVDVILETGQASVSMLQRRLKLGYARAARIVDEMEEKGIVGPFQGSKPRAILITKEQWQAQKGGTQMDFDDLALQDE
ncbi:MAG: DNA translocase FtsK [Eubacteriales bacterium]|nr:DNA translocase FtsK [Eubacteriales bacterium]